MIHILPVADADQTLCDRSLASLPRNDWSVILALRELADCPVCLAIDAREQSRARYVAAAVAVPVALFLFVGSHWLMRAEGADQWERGAYLVWSGQCDRAEVLCKKTALEYIARMPKAKCDTDTDCMQKFGGDGGPGID